MINRSHLTLPLLPLHHAMALPKSALQHLPPYPTYSKHTTTTTHAPTSHPSLTTPPTPPSLSPYISHLQYRIPAYIPPISPISPKTLAPFSSPNFQSQFPLPPRSCPSIALGSTAVAAIAISSGSDTGSFISTRAGEGAGRVTETKTEMGIKRKHSSSESKSEAESEILNDNDHNTTTSKRARLMSRQEDKLIYSSLYSSTSQHQTCSMSREQAQNTTPLQQRMGEYTSRLLEIAESECGTDDWNERDGMISRSKRELNWTTGTCG